MKIQITLTREQEAQAMYELFAYRHPREAMEQDRKRFLTFAAGHAGVDLDKAEKAFTTHEKPC